MELNKEPGLTNMYCSLLSHPYRQSTTYTFFSMSACTCFLSDAISLIFYLHIWNCFLADLYLSTLFPESVRNWWGNRDGAVLFQQKLKLHKGLPVWGMLNNHLQHSCFYSSFFSSSMLLFIHLCNWDNLWNPAAWLLVWWSWNANAIAKLTVVSFPGFSILSVSWFSGNKVQDLLFPCLACCARFSHHIRPASSLLCPLSGWDCHFLPGISHSNSFPQCFVCPSVCALTVLQL